MEADDGERQDAMAPGGAQNSVLKEIVPSGLLSSFSKDKGKPSLKAQGFLTANTLS